MPASPLRRAVKDDNGHIHVAPEASDSTSLLSQSHQGVMVEAQRRGAAFDLYDPKTHRGFLDAEGTWIPGDIGDIRLAEMYDRDCPHCGGTGKVQPGVKGVLKTS